MPVNPITGREELPETVEDGIGVKSVPIVRVAKATYDFAVKGGVVGDIPLDDVVPLGAVIVGGYLRVLTAVTGGANATAAVKVEGAADIVAAAVVTGAPWSTTGFKSVIPVATGATMLITTAKRRITVTVAVADLTAGKFDVMLFYHK